MSIYWCFQIEFESGVRQQKSGAPVKNIQHDVR